MKTVVTTLFMLVGINLLIGQQDSTNTYFKVDKQFDENGNVTQYDSVFMSSNIPFNTYEIDSIFNSFGMGEYNFEFPDITMNFPFFNDSILSHFFPDSYFSDSTFLSVPSFGPNTGFPDISTDVNRIFEEMEEMRREFFRELEEVPDITVPPGPSVPTIPKNEQKLPNNEEKLPVNPTKIYNI